MPNPSVLCNASLEADLLLQAAPNTRAFPAQGQQELALRLWETGQRRRGLALTWEEST